jgi:ubiquinone/menaquinone biosynthesis C-methylase UbiE
LKLNYFSPQSVARRYVKGRPYFHPIIVDRIKEFLRITEPLSSVLDVGCGTGLSTIALKEAAKNIIGLDISPEMVSLAPVGKGVSYVVANAEYLPFADNGFDLLTLCQVFHWLDRNRFLTEANRVLRQNGWLAAYDNYFSGQMIDNPEFHAWYKEYLARYPAPPRGEITFTSENTGPHGFQLIKEVRYDNTIKLSLEGLVDYLVTQSNVIALVEFGREHIEEARTWLMGVLGPMFGRSAEREFSFAAPIWYLQRVT